MSLFRYATPNRGRSIIYDLAHLEKPMRRKQPCRLCSATEAYSIADVTFWDLEQSTLVACPQCRLVQLDAMISEPAMNKGVFAYYLWQRAHESAASQAKNAARNFRKGYAFARSLRARSQPQHILELGPGSGWFLRGVQRVFPNARYFAWDMVPDVAKTMADLHGFVPVSGDLGSLPGDTKFDLIIARDVLEHFADVGSELKSIFSLLAPQGQFHFITPNGHEDLWKFFAAKKLGKTSPSELLLNHVNYFDGRGLLECLEKLGFRSHSYFAYDLSAWKAGIGWRVSASLAAGSHGLKADETIAQYSAITPETGVFEPPKLTWYRKLWYIWKAWHAMRLNPQRNFGHEFFGIFYKP